MKPFPRWFEVEEKAPLCSHFGETADWRSQDPSLPHSQLLLYCLELADGIMGKTGFAYLFPGPAQMMPDLTSEFRGTAGHLPFSTLGLSNEIEEVISTPEHPELYKIKTLLQKPINLLASTLDPIPCWLLKASSFLFSAQSLLLWWIVPWLSSRF